IVTFLANADEFFVGALKPGRPHLSIFVPNSTETVHMRASRQSTQFSISARIARRSAVSRAMNFLALACRELFPVARMYKLTSGHYKAVLHIREKVMPRLVGKIAIVTGGAKGIGRHYSQALANEGARVMIADIADGSELAEEISGRHGANSVAAT